MSRLTRLLFPLAGIGAIAGLIMFTSTGTLQAADHGDSPSVATNSGDIADHYAWMTDDGSKLVMVMTLASGFQNGVQYVFHINSMATYGATTSVANIILCTVRPSGGGGGGGGGGMDAVECFVSNDDSTSGGSNYKARLVGGRDTEIGDATFKVQAGNFDDPFFFNGAGFGAVVTAAQAGVGSLQFDDKGCVQLPPATSAALVTQLAQNAVGDPGTDDFGGSNIDAIVIEIDKSMINAGGEILATYSSTRSGS